jgi:hypothetical protein
MKKALLRFYVQEDKSLCVKITCDEECEGKEAPRISVAPDGEVVISVLDFEIDYEKSGKLWFNQLNFYFGPDAREDETKVGCIFVKVKNADDGLMNVSIQPLDE